MAEEPGATFGGVTFGAGQWDQATEHLGAAALLAAWLTTTLNRPIEAGTRHPAGTEPAAVDVSLGWTDCSLVAVGSPAAVDAALRRADELLARPEVEIDDALRDRARAYPASLRPWSSHLVARWPGHRPHLAALGPLALDTLDPAAIAGFAATLTRARRVTWTNELSLTFTAGPDPPELPPDVRGEPGCLPRLAPGQLFSIALPDTPAAQLALSLLAGALHRRLVEFEPLVSNPTLQVYAASAHTVIACATGVPLPGKDEAALAAVAQTLEDLAESPPAAEFERVRAAMAADARAGTDLTSPAGMVALARRRLARPDALPDALPDARAEAIEGVEASEVTEALVAAYTRGLFVTTTVGEPPFPLAERAAPRAAAGRRFRDWTAKRRSVRCSDERIGVVEKVPARGVLGPTLRSVTRASVDFAEVVLRLDAGEDRTILVDEQLFEMRLWWGAYSRGLRELVDRHTAEVPVVRQPPEPGTGAAIATAVRRARRRIVVGGVAAVAALGTFVTLVAVDASRRTSEATTVRTVAAGETATLGNGATVSVVGEPELISRYNAHVEYGYAVQVRACGGTDLRNKDNVHHPRNHFAAELFTMRVGDLPAMAYTGVRERPGPPGTHLARGACATGWVLFQLPAPNRDAGPTLRYRNIPGDELTWHLPPGKPSPLSKPP